MIIVVGFELAVIVWEERRMVVVGIITKTAFPK